MRQLRQIDRRAFRLIDLDHLRRLPELAVKQQRRGVEIAGARKAREHLEDLSPVVLTDRIVNERLQLHSQRVAFAPRARPRASVIQPAIGHCSP